MIKRLLVFLVLGVATSVGFSTSASATQPESHHCIMNQAGASACFASEAAALNAASGGRIQLKPGSSAEQIKAAIIDSNATASKTLSPNTSDVFSPNATVIHAELFTQANHQGSELVLYASTVCVSGHTYVWNNFAYPWNDNIYSGQLFAGCYGRGYDSDTVGGSGAQFQFPYQANENDLHGFDGVMGSFKSCGNSC